MTSSNPIPPAPIMPEHGRRANPDLEPVEIVGDDLRQDLRQHRKQDGLNVTGAGRPQRFQRLRIDIFDRLGVEAAEYSAEIDPSASAPGNGPNPTADTKKIAQINSETLRRTLRMASAEDLKTLELFRFFAARMPSGNPIIDAITVPPKRDADRIEGRPQRPSSAVQSGGTILPI